MGFVKGGPHKLCGRFTAAGKAGKGKPAASPGSESEGESSESEGDEAPRLSKSGRIRIKRVKRE
jgi:hypothetical protein